VLRRAAALAPDILARAARGPNAWFSGIGRPVRDRASIDSGPSTPRPDATTLGSARAAPGRSPPDPPERSVRIPPRRGGVAELQRPGKTRRILDHYTIAEVLLKADKSQGHDRAERMTSQDAYWTRYLGKDVLRHVLHRQVRRASSPRDPWPNRSAGPAAHATRGPTGRLPAPATRRPADPP
jgi:hypothetical protein